MLLVLSGCGSSGRVSNGWGRDYEPSSLTENDGRNEFGGKNPEAKSRPAKDQNDIIASKFKTASSLSERALESLLRNELDGWMGVPYKLGGTSKRGVDCSALVQNVFADALNVVIPRTTEKQLQIGDHVNVSSLRSGDLVFFKPSPNYRHVGIYLSEGNFGHASSSRGVMISNLSETYWKRVYTGARRIIGSKNLISEVVSNTDRSIETFSELRR
ncbi:MAG: hypothetical protein BMS9Abin05_2026 [Rhodothermia bacterium]|nr:MAG: hypothetical protein BMS9Abin05_2026 [Rhodothermia bacterium]